MNAVCTFPACIPFVIGLGLLGCSGAADEYPLGGPYGGSTNSVGASSGGNSAQSSQPDDNAAAPDDGTDPSANAPDTTVDDAGAPTKLPDGGSAATPSAAPTWTTIYTKYLAAGTIGDCGSCHSSMRTASGAYGYMQRKRQISGTSSKMASPSGSRLSWLGGDMPPDGPTSDAKATADIKAWAQAGGLQN